MADNFLFFSYTFEKIQEGSDRVWKFQRYDLILEYHDRPTLVPPFMILSHIFIFIKWIVQMCGCGPKAVYGSALSKFFYFLNKKSMIKFYSILSSR